MMSYISALSTDLKLSFFSCRYLADPPRLTVPARMLKISCRSTFSVFLISSKLSNLMLYALQRGLSCFIMASEFVRNCLLNIDVEQNVSVVASYRSPSWAVRPSACREISAVPTIDGVDDAPPIAHARNQNLQQISTLVYWVAVIGVGLEENSGDRTIGRLFPGRFHSKAGPFGRLTVYSATKNVVKYGVVREKLSVMCSARFWIDSSLFLIKFSKVSGVEYSNTDG